MHRTFSRVLVIAAAVMLAVGVIAAESGSAQTSTIQFASDLSVASGALSAGQGFALGDLFVADHGQIVEYTAEGAVVRTYTDPRFVQLFDLAFSVSSDELYFTDAIAHDVKVLDGSGNLIRIFGEGFLAQPRGIAVYSNGDVYVADTGGNDVDVFDAGGNHLRSIGPVPVPLNLAFSADGRRLFVSESNYFVGVQVFDLASGDRLDPFGETSTRVGLTNGLAVAPDGTLYVGDGIFGGGTDTVKVFNADGSFVRTLISGLTAPIDLTFDGNEDVWLTNTNDFVGDQIYAYTDSGAFIKSFGADLQQPTGLAFLLPAGLPAPVADAGPDQAVECGGHSGTPVTLDGSGSTGDGLSFVWRAEDGSVVGTDSTVTLSLLPGSYVFTLTVNDARGRSATDRVIVRIRDTVAPSLAVTLSPAILWPATHALVSVTAAISTIDACDASPSVSLVSITSSEADEGLGDGDTANDIEGAELGTDDRVFSLRAERGGGDSGRTYSITYRVEDASGNASTASARVVVPRDMRQS